MKISNINAHSTNKIPEFKGLWGKTYSSKSLEPALCIEEVKETKYYYPFSDENKDDVNKIINSNKKANIVNIDGKDKYIVNDCMLCQTLPFERKQYEKYMKLRDYSNINDLNKRIHYFTNGKFINADNKNQVSASNQYLPRNSFLV